ncbi:DNA polymerase III subunit gamma/tau [Alphaproteobacteria bacterium]|nr:DNA polymerase III subunit gamma/tau [Alphaproteobacteria bacterium]
MNKKKSTVLALKYRPNDFKDLIGQEYLVETVKKSIQLDKIPNAYIFTGIRGVGKTTTARIVAKMLNCTVFDDNKNPLIDQCDQAKAIAEDRHPDVLEIDAASNTSVDNAREIIENVKYSPVMGKYKVYIIDEVHMLSKSAFNALLKTLEEPPEHSKFIFATTEISKVPITILSRCQKFDLRRIDKSTMFDFLKKIVNFESIEITDKALHMIIKAGDGSVRDNLSILDQANIFKANQKVEDQDIVNMLGFAKQTDIYDLALQITGNQMNKLLVVLQDMYQRGTETSKVIEELMAVTNWALKIKINPDLLNDDFLSEEDKIFAKSIDHINEGQLNIFWQSLMKGYEEIKISPNPYITLEMILLRSCFLIHGDSNLIQDEKKKSKINFTKEEIEKLEKKNIKTEDSQVVKKLSIQDRINFHEDFFQFYGNEFSPLMASIILENCEIIFFDREEKILKISASNKNFPGFSELSANLKNIYRLSFEESKNVILFEELKEIFKQNLIKAEINSDEFKKVLAKFPNAKILDLQEIERDNENDG